MNPGLNVRDGLDAYCMIPGQSVNGRAVNAVIMAARFCKHMACFANASGRFTPFGARSFCGALAYTRIIRHFSRKIVEKKLRTRLYSVRVRRFFCFSSRLTSFFMKSSG